MSSMVSTTTRAIATVALCMGTAFAHGQRVTAAGLVPAAQVDMARPGSTTVAYELQAKDDLLEGLDRLGANAKERNEVNLDKNTLALAGGKKGGRYGDLAQKMDFISVRNYEFAQKGQYQRSDLEALRHRLEGSGWSHIVRNESDGETNDIVVKGDREGFLSDMVILNAEAKELSIVHLRGHFRMEDVQGATGGTMGAGMGALGSGMGGSTGHVTAAQHQPSTPPESPELKKR